jgi:DNA-binding CsgD family transcriptional regulator
MSTLEMLPAYSDEVGIFVRKSAPLTVVDPETGAFCREDDSNGRAPAPRPRQIGNYESTLIRIFSQLFQPADPRLWTAGVWDPAEMHGVAIEENCAGIYLLAASLVAARRMTEAASLLRQLDAIAASRPGWRAWRGRSEFLWAVHAEQTGDIPAVLRHSATATELIETIDERPLDSLERGRCRLLKTVDAVAREQLPLLAARARIGLGEPHQAQSILENRYGSAEAAEAGQPSMMARLACGQGRLSDALRLATVALDNADLTDAPTEIVSLEARVVLAEVLFERNSLDAAEEHLQAALQLCYVTQAAPWMWIVQTHLARLSVAQQRATEATPRLEHLRQVRKSGLLPRPLLRELNRVEVDYRIELGDLEDAVRIVKTSPPHDFDCDTLARVELFSGRPDQVIARLRSDRTPSPAAHIRRLILVACAEKQEGRAEKATNSLRLAVEAAQGEQYVRPFLQLAAQVCPLLRHMGRSASNIFLSQLLSHVGPIAASPVTGKDVTLLEPLTDREWEVLQHLGSHRTQRQIASLMFVSNNTVKTHVKSIYRKTGVSSRDEAVTIARAHGII